MQLLSRESAYATVTTVKNGVARDVPKLSQSHPPSDSGRRRLYHSDIGIDAKLSELDTHR
jgi:hypothetical protein